MLCLLRAVVTFVPKVTELSLVLRPHIETGDINCTTEDKPPCHLIINHDCELANRQKILCSSLDEAYFPSVVYFR